jgi:hypothetical protein
MECWLELDRWGRGGSLNDQSAGARARVAPGVGGYVVDRVRRYLRRIDPDVSGQNAVDEGR